MTQAQTAFLKSRHKSSVSVDSTQTALCPLLCLPFLGFMGEKQPMHDRVPPCCLMWFSSPEPRPSLGTRTVDSVAVVTLMVKNTGQTAVAKRSEPRRSSQALCTYKHAPPRHSSLILSLFSALVFDATTPRPVWLLSISTHFVVFHHDVKNGHGFVTRRALH